MSLLFFQMRGIERDLDRVELFLIENGAKDHELTWDKLALQFRFEVTSQTLCLNMAPRAVYTFLAAKKPWIDKKLAKLCVK